MRFIHEEQIQDAASYEPLNEGLAWLRGVCERREVPAIRRQTEPLLKRILDEDRPARILEIGTAIGYSACFMATVLPAAQITTIEVYDRSFYDAKEAIERLGLTDRIEQILGDAAEVLPRLADDGRQYDLVFIDAAKSHYRTYFEDSLCLTKSGLFTGIGHPDHVKLFGHRPSFSLEGYYEKLACELEKAGMYADQNSGAYRRNPEVAELGMNPALLRALVSHDVKIVTSSDAHCPEDVGYKIKELGRLVGEAGGTCE